MQNKATVFYKGGKTSYTFPFPYLSKQFVKVRYDKGNSSVLLEYNKDYTVEGQTVSLQQAGSEADMLCIYRQTPTGSLVDFNDGSVLLASELDKMSVQLLHVAEENNDAIYLNGMFTDDDAWQAQGRRIKNVAAPSAPSDAVNLEYLDSVGVVRADELRRIEKNIAVMNDEVTLSRNLSASNSQAAAISEQNASQSEANAKTSETLVRGMQHAAAQYTDTTRQLSEEARDFRDAAEIAADTAKQNALAANTSANTAGASAAAAAESAKKAAASAGLDGLVKTENIADQAVTSEKVGQSVWNKVKDITSRIVGSAMTYVTPIFNQPPASQVVHVNDTFGYKGELVLSSFSFTDYEGYQVKYISKAYENYKVLLYHFLPAWHFKLLVEGGGMTVLFDGTNAAVLSFKKQQGLIKVSLKTTNDNFLIQGVYGVKFSA